MAERSPDPKVCWVILTQGDRNRQLRAAIASIRHAAPDHDVLVVGNGAQIDPIDDCEIVNFERNLGIPGGRDAAIRMLEAEVVAFLDDDATLVGDWAAELPEGFDDPCVAAVSFRIVDELGDSNRRHIPRAGTRGADRSGPVATFLGGACALRRSAYLDVGGYWSELWYGHEELELSWRLHDAGYSVRYDADATVFHPRTEVGRHPDGWRKTGRNRVWIARRTLPRPLSYLHAMTWLVLGLVRAGSAPARRGYVEGWWSGWSTPVDRRPIRWRTVWGLSRLGRPPIV